MSSASPKNNTFFFKKFVGFVREATHKIIRKEKEMAEGGRKDKLGGRDRDTGKVFPEWCWG